MTLPPSSCTPTVSNTGSVWRATQKSTNRAVVIKITDKKLHANSMTVIDGQRYKVRENIKAEKQILKYLTTKAKCPKSIVKYVDFFRSNFNYYLVRYCTLLYTMYGAW